MTHLRRLTTLAELANVAAFMASDQASAMTGTVANLRVAPSSNEDGCGRYTTEYRRVGAGVADTKWGRSARAATLDNME
jgi:hypothetical protein